MIKGLNIRRIIKIVVQSIVIPFLFAVAVLMVFDIRAWVLCGECSNASPRIVGDMIWMFVGLLWLNFSSD